MAGDDLRSKSDSKYAAPAFPSFDEILGREQRITGSAIQADVPDSVVSLAPDREQPFRSHIRVGTSALIEPAKVNDKHDLPDLKGEIVFNPIPALVKSGENPARQVAKPAEKVEPKLQLTGYPAEKASGIISAKEAKLPDGKYIRDDAGRVTETVSPDGKMKRKFEYGDPKLPDTATVIHMDGMKYQILGPITSNGKPVERDGKVMYSWTRYDDKGNFKDNWYGALVISKNGVFDKFDDHLQKDQKSLQGADGKELSAAEAARRNTHGIWPGKIDVSRPDGTSINAKMEGDTALEITETYLDKGKLSQRIWKKQGESWQSNTKPEERRTNVQVDREGNFTYTDSNARRITEQKDVGRIETDKGITTTLDPEGAAIKVTTADGERSLVYGMTKAGKKQLTEITTTSGEYKTKWLRDGDSDSWKAASESELRKDLKLTASGDLRFVDDKGRQIQETTALSRIRFDDSSRPVEIHFTSGAKRSLQYDDKGLKSFRDELATKTDKQDILWTRKGDGTTFESRRADGKTYERQSVVPKDNGDLSYKGLDGQNHVSVARDLDRMARGELILSAESLLEARNKLQDVLATTSLDQKRFLSWLKEFEARATGNKLPQEKIVKTMENLAALLSQSKDGPVFNKTEREIMADTAMHNLARPLEIDQGSHPTCNVTSIEVYAAVKHPDQYTRLLREVANNGKWTTAKGETVTPPVKALTAGKDEKSYDLTKPDSNLRNRASQVVQMTLINGMYETGRMDKIVDKKITEDRTGWRYVLGPNREKVEILNGSQVTTDLGEDLLIGKDNKPIKDKNGNDVSEPSMVQDNVIASGEMMFGETAPYIKCSGYADIPGQERKYFNYLPDSKEMLKFKEDGRLPILTPTMGGMHAQTIHDVWQDPKSGKVWVLLDNQHGEPEVKGKGRNSGEGDGDGWIELDTLHKTLKMRGQGTEFGKPVMPTITKNQHPKDQVR